MMFVWGWTSVFSMISIQVLKRTYAWGLFNNRKKDVLPEVKAVNESHNQPCETELKHHRLWYAKNLFDRAMIQNSDMERSNMVSWFRDQTAVLPKRQTDKLVQGNGTLYMITYFCSPYMLVTHAVALILITDIRRIALYAWHDLTYDPGQLFLRCFFNF